MYTSTRKKLNYNASNCIIKGISDDGGLFIYDRLNEFTIDESLINLSYQDLSFKILKFFLNDFDDEEINEVIEKSYNKVNFPVNMLNVHTLNKLSFMELYHGPTLAFKDMALTILPNLLQVSKTLPSAEGMPRRRISTFPQSRNTPIPAIRWGCLYPR